MSVHVSEVERLLAAWERGQPLTPARRALLLLGLAYPESDAGELLAAPLGWRNRALLRLRERWFGPALDAFAECPACGERLELQLPAAQVLAAAEPPPAAPAGCIERDGFTVEVRAPVSADLIGIETCTDAGQAARRLAEACVRSAAGPEGHVEAGALPEGVFEQIGERLRALDPLAEILVELDCAQCRHAWQAALDLPAFLWRELSVRARRLLLEVDALARAYGWSERDILAMSSFRRQCYLELLLG